MSQFELWSELSQGLYAKAGASQEIKKAFRQGLPPVAFKNQHNNQRNTVAVDRSSYWNVFSYDEGVFTQEYQNLKRDAVFVNKEEQLEKALSVGRIYFAASPQMTSVKTKILSLKEPYSVDLGVDPYSLGLWQSQIYKSSLDVDWSSVTKSKQKIFRISSLAYDLAGASPTQQLSFFLSSFVQLVEDYEGTLSPEQLFAMTSFELSLDSNLFLGLSRIRALQTLINRLQNAYGLKEARPITLFTVASPRFLATRETWNNILRLATVNMVSLMGGAQGCVQLAYDLFTKSSQGRLSRNMDLILQQESYLDRVMDPLRGSYSLEAFTESLAERGWQFFQETYKKEGLRHALRSGWLQSQIEFANKQQVGNFLNNQNQMTGINSFPLKESLSEENFLPQLDQVVDIEAWWLTYTEQESCEKLCDVERLIPLRLSDFFEKWQFRADQLRQTGQSPSIKTYVEPGLEHSKKYLSAKKIMALVGFDLVTDHQGVTGDDIGLIVAYDPEGEFASNLSQEMKSQNSFCLWAGEKSFDQFDGFVGETTDLMTLFERLYEYKGGQ